MTECRYELKQPFEYSYKGEQIEATFITMTAPNYSQVGKAAPIKQAFATAMKERFAGVDVEAIAEAQEEVKEAEKTDVEDTDNSLDSAFIMATMYQWSGDITKVLHSAGDLFKAGAAKIEGETPFTSSLLGKVDMVDFDGMVGMYLANFIVPSLTDGQ